MRRKVLIIARATLLEARRTRLHWLVALALLLAFGASLFVHQIAITESARIQTAFLAASTRLAGVFIVGLYIISTMVREFNDKGLELMLSLDLPRAVYLLGRLAGFAAIALLVALAMALPQLWLAPPAAALLWGASLALELLIVAAASLFCIVTFSQIMPAASLVLAFYFLARSITAIRLMSNTALLDELAPGRSVLSLLADALALVLPPLDAFTQSAWLVNSSGGAGDLARAAVHSAVYCALLVAAALFDFYRRDL